jgi:hypothetical protein
MQKENHHFAAASSPMTFKQFTKGLVGWSLT